MEHLHDAEGCYTAAFGKIHMWPPKGFRFTQLTEGKGSRWMESSGSQDNTRITYASDHGDHVGDWSRGDMALSDYIGNNRTVRGTALITNRFKYAYWGREFGSEFYDLQEDPHEMRNLAHDPTAQAPLREHHGLLTDRLLATATPPLDMIGPEWE